LCRSRRFRCADFEQAGVVGGESTGALGDEIGWAIVRQFPAGNFCRTKPADGTVFFRCSAAFRAAVGLSTVAAWFTAAIPPPASDPRLIPFGEFSCASNCAL
jgi:hypothetical protein